MMDLRLVPASVLPSALENNLRNLRTRDKIYKHFLEAIRRSFAADSAWFSRRLRHNRRVNERMLCGDASLCNENLLEPFARLERPVIPKNVLLSPYRPHGRIDGVVGVAARDRDFEVGRGRRLNRLTALLVTEIERRDREMTTRVLGRIQDKALSGLTARDLAYQILDALYQLIRYDHSAAILIHDPSHGTFRIVAEKIVWIKSKSTRVGTEIPAAREIIQKLNCDPTVVLEKGVWRPETGQAMSTHLVSAVTSGGQLLGLVDLASSSRLPFDGWDRTVVERFLAVTSFCLRTLS
jgi:hypothetical protein